MKEHGGFVDGVDYYIDARAADGRAETLLPLALELVGTDPDLILATTTGSTQAVRSVTSSVPIVMTNAHDPVEAGVVASLDRPGGNVTGVSLVGSELIAQQLDVLREVVPVTRVAYLTPNVPPPTGAYPSVTDMFERAMRTHAKVLSIEVHSFWLTDRASVDDAIGGITTDSVDAIFVIESPIWFSPSDRPAIDRIAEIALQRRLASISGLSVYPQHGLLMSYGDSRLAPQFLKSASRYAAAILKGAHPADMPIERPGRFVLTVNARTVAALGLSLSRTPFDRADVVLR
jgi:putative ABC transport system substrate-binding protein